MPPYLAGREAQQVLFRTLLRRLEERAPLPGELILYGPRGNGKTVLLRWLEGEAVSSRIETVVLLPSEIPDGDRLAEYLRPRKLWDRLVPGQLGIGGVSRARRENGAPASSVSQILTARARRSPLLVLVDEAHTLDVAAGRMLLNASQRVRDDGAFLLVLAGTPNIEGHLGAMGASFWSRARQVRIGRLDERGTADAFRRPFAVEGAAVNDDVMADVVRLTHGYPYFIQLLGQEVWGIALGSDGPCNITTTIFDAALPEFGRAEGDYLRHRYFELRKRRLLGVGRSVAAAFLGRETLTDEELTEAVRSELGDPSDYEAAERAEGVLADLGFIWGTSPAPGWEPGIPSLMDYILEFTNRDRRRTT